MAEPSFETVMTAIDQLLSGALDETQMPAAAEALRQLFEGPKAGFGRFDPYQGGRAGHDAGTGEDNGAFVSDDLAADFIAMGEAIRSIPLAAACRGADPRGPEGAGRPRDWPEGGPPRGLYGATACRLPEKGEALWFFDGPGGSERPRFDAAEASLLRKLAPVFRRVVEIRRQIGRIAVQRDEARDALDALALGVAIVDHDLRILHANIGADEILAEPDGAITLRQGRLCARHGVDQRLLKRRIDEALQSVSDPLAPHQTSLILRGSERAHVVSACIMPAPPSPAGSHGKVMIALRRLDLSTDMASCARQLFDLTDTEAKFASALASGLSLAEAAEAQGVRISTARTHLARIFQKTDTRQQSQLVSLLRSAALPLRQR